MNSVFQDGICIKSDIGGRHALDLVREIYTQKSQGDEDVTLSIVDINNNVTELFSNRSIEGTIIKPKTLEDGDSDVDTVTFDATEAVLSLPFERLVSIKDNYGVALEIAKGCTGLQPPFTILLTHSIAKYFGVSAISEITRSMYDFVQKYGVYFVEHVVRPNDVEEFSDFVDAEIFIRDGTADWKFKISMDKEFGEIHDYSPEYSATWDDQFVETEMKPSVHV